MCGNSNPTPTPEAEKKYVTREFLVDKLREIKEKVSRTWATAPYQSVSEAKANETLRAVEQLQSELATMQFGQPPAATPPFDLTEDQEREILGHRHTLGGLAIALVDLYNAVPSGNRLYHVMDELSAMAMVLNDEDDDKEDEDEDEDEEGSISESLKYRVLHNLEGLAEAASPLDRAQKLTDALSELYDSSPYLSELEKMSEGLMDASYALVDALSAAKDKDMSGTLELKLMLNGVEVPLRRVQ